MEQSPTSTYTYAVRIAALACVPVQLGQNWFSEMKKMVDLVSLKGYVITAVTGGGAPKDNDIRHRTQRLSAQNCEVFFQHDSKGTLRANDGEDPKMSANSLPQSALNVLLIAITTAYDS